MFERERLTSSTVQSSQKLLAIIDLAEKKPRISIDNISALFGCSRTGSRALVDKLVATGLIIKTPGACKSVWYSLADDKPKLTAARKELNAVVAAYVPPKEPSHYKPRAERQPPRFVDYQPAEFRHSELHCRLFWSVYKDWFKVT